MADEASPLSRLAIELLARTDMRVSERCELEDDAVVAVDDGHWLRIMKPDDDDANLPPRLLDITALAELLGGSPPHRSRSVRRRSGESPPPRSRRRSPVSTAPSRDVGSLLLWW